ncbi:hypothetical protein SUGI_0461250 [Cryptomeria japonica]|uniref:embryo-specific protein ATS3A n=1 Tax=Cryptomeria japonica TaxID=3369 RepID=UPI0024089D82|nr:embryo-specific protein ATS3A [Cryptomeria japonica]GLJ24181.1 hypothetical protein SUGI_0461250 [Cryptomeria japonica]
MAWRLQILGFLLINLALLACICATAQEENCSYTLEVETSCYLLSGTDERVLVRFGDKSFYDKNKTEVLERHLSESMNEGNAKPFKRCKTDKFNLSGPCVKDKLCYAYFKVDGKDDWRVNHAIIYHENGEDIFRLDKKLPGNAWYGREFCDKNFPMLASLAEAEDAHKHVNRKLNQKRKPRA